ncbi:hypothetical protein [Ornithinimicrobium sediminis]|uniref:hypothetical protein n=1 Tax=Ornithinimicrobium sediminis TaxID=2904603 RepID=UPI001E452993|nr:hypothetical protein [Ornithinimicrobium sediminis]MCE0486889.1 hypothetical protein [Ornithinimicrobium sediminis]
MSGSWRPGADVGVVHEDPLRQGSGAGEPTIYVAHLPDGPIQVLQGPAAVIFTACLLGEAGELQRRVADALGVPADDLDAEVLAEFVTEMEHSRLITRAPV